MPQVVRARVSPARFLASEVDLVVVACPGGLAASELLSSSASRNESEELQKGREAGLEPAAAIDPMLPEISPVIDG